LLFFDEKLSAFLRLGNYGLIAVEKSDRAQIIAQGLRIGPFIFLDDSHQIECLPVGGAFSGIGCHNLFGFRDDRHESGLGSLEIFPRYGELRKADIRKGCGIGVGLCEFGEGSLGCRKLIERKIDVTEQGARALGPLHRQSTERFHERLEEAEGFVCIASLPGPETFLIGLWWGLCYRSHLLHWDAGLGRPDLDFQLSAGESKNLAFASLTVLLQNDILCGERGGGRKNGRQSHPPKPGRTCIHFSSALITTAPQINSFAVLFMITILRQHQRALMLVVAVLTIVAFIWLYNPAETHKLGSNEVANIYGRKVSQADIEREVKNYQLALALGQFSLLENLGGMAANENQALDEFIWNLFVLHHEAEELGVKPTDSQVADRIKTIRAFQTGGQFDPAKYKTFVLEQLGPRGFTEVILENVIRDALSVERIKAIVASPAGVSDAEFQETARVLQQFDAQAVRFPLASVASETLVTDEEVKDFHRQYGPALSMPETRSVEYVKFALAGDGKPLEGRQKVEALQKLADAAMAFSEQALQTSFEKAASAGGLTVQKSPEFERSGSAKSGGNDTIVSDLKNLAPAAFLLTEASPVSDVIQSGDAFFVLKLAKVNPQRPLTIDEVRPLAEKQLGARKAERLLRERADPALARVRKAMAAGKSFADAAAAEGLQVQSFNDLDPSGENLSPEQQGIAAATLLMQPGQLSGMISDAEGGFAVYLFERAPLDAAALERKPELTERILESKRRLLFQTWLSSARDAAKIAIASDAQ
jgi:hypothetical protein